MPLLLALASSLIYGTADFLGGLGARRGPLVTVTAYFQVLGVLPLVGYALLAPGETRASDLAWAASSGVCGGLGVMLLYRALATGTVSTAAPLISMIALTVPVLVGFASGERPGWLPLLGIVAGAVAVTLIAAHGTPDATGDRHDAGAPDARGLALAVASGLLIGGFLVCLGRVAPGSSGWPLVAGRTSATTCLWLMLFASRSPLRLPAPAWPPVIGAALTDVTANVLYLLAVQRAPLSLVATIVSLAPATTVALAQVVLHERLGRTQKWGVALALVAVLLLARGV